MTFDEGRANYWSRPYQRRAVLRGGGALGLGTAGLVLVGCGGGKGDTGGLGGIATPTPGAGASATVDPFAGAKPGGTIRLSLPSDPPTLDPYGNISFYTKYHAAAVYGRLFKYKTGPGIKSADVRPTGDLAASAENSPDGLTWTVKLKPGVKFQNLAPVNGRTVTTDDVKFSYARATDKKYANASQFGFVDKVTYPDASTIVFTLKSVNVTFLDVLADLSLLVVMPTESDGKFDPTIASIGSGPWIFDKYQVSSSISYRKNPDWYETGFPLADRLEYPILPDYPNRVAQFLAGNLDGETLLTDDLISARKSNPALQVYGDIGNALSFFAFDIDPSSPWVKDERIRQAISMSLDRDALADLAYDNKKLRAAGIEVASPWNNIVPAGLSRFWLDPQGKDQGASAQFFKYDPAAAKQLLSAAGVPNPSMTYMRTVGRYGKAFDLVAEAQIDYINAIGVRLAPRILDYATEFITHVGLGDFLGIKGMSFQPQSAFADAGGYVTRMFTDNPVNTGNVNKPGGPQDPEILKLVDAQQRETDYAKRKEMIWQIQRLQDTHMYYIPGQIGTGTNFTAYQTNVKNATTFRTSLYGANAETLPYWWKSS